MRVNIVQPFVPNENAIPYCVIETGFTISKNHRKKELSTIVFFVNNIADGWFICDTEVVR